MRVVLKDWAEGSAGETVSIRVEHRGDYLCLIPEGYGEPEADRGEGVPILLEFYNGRLRLVVSPDILDEGKRRVIDLEGARESRVPD